MSKQSAAARLPDEKGRLAQQINKLVYELYGLSDEEIKIIEGS